MKVFWAPIGVMPLRHEARTYEPSERMRYAFVLSLRYVCRMACRRSLWSCSRIGIMSSTRLLRLRGIQSADEMKTSSRPPL